MNSNTSLCKISNWCIPFLIRFILLHNVSITDGFSFPIHRTLSEAPSTVLKYSTYAPTSRRCSFQTKIYASSSENKDDDYVTNKEQNNGENFNKTLINFVNGILRNSQRSYKNVEGNTFKLLSKQPAVALAIFIGMGIIVAYLTGFFFLGGYISSGNPYENGAIPYWDEDVCEICKTIQNQGK